MIGILSSVLKTATREESWNNKSKERTHAELLLHHERRKREENPAQDVHVRRYFW